jgi:hypothetical protein
MLVPDGTEPWVENVSRTLKFWCIGSTCEVLEDDPYDELLLDEYDEYEEYEG